MATDFLTLEQTCEALGLNQSQAKALVAEGRLHEYRDAGKIFFKRTEVDKLAAKEGSSIVDLAATDEILVDAGGEKESFASTLSSMADSSSSLGLGAGSPTPKADEPSELNLMSDSSLGSGSAVGLSPLEMSPDDFPKDLPAASAEVPDLGLSGSSIISLEPTSEDNLIAPPPKPDAKKAGIAVFEDEEIEIAADPMGETRISSGVDELEAVGSGSGLLDLTQVSDDTSLGAELLDVISPSEAETATDGTPVVEAAETVEDSGAIMAETMPEQSAAMPGPSVVPTAVAAKVATSMTLEMPGTTWMNITLLLGILSMALVGLATAGQLQGVWPSFLTPIARDVVHYSVFGGLGLSAIVFGVLAILADKK